MTAKLKRAKQGRIINGTCAGLAEYLNLPTGLVRLLFLICMFPFPFLIVLYFLCYFFIYSEDKVDIDNSENTFHGINLTDEFDKLDQNLSRIESKLSQLESFTIQRQQFKDNSQ